MTIPSKGRGGSLLPKYFHGVFDACRLKVKLKTDMNCVFLVSKKIDSVILGYSMDDRCEMKLSLDIESKCIEKYGKTEFG